MLPATDDLKAALRFHHTGGTRAQARYQGATTDLRVSDSSSVLMVADQQVQTSASNVHAFGVGGSLVPHSKTDPLATYGQELALWRTVDLRSSHWEIPLGVFRITAATDAVERYRADTVLDWSVSLTLKDRFEAIVADDFLSPDGPGVSVQVWDEIRRLSRFPVQEALGNSAVPIGTVYKTRYDAIATLMGLLGGVPHLTREGVLTARKADAWLTSTVAQFDINGTIAWSSEMSNDFYNQVLVTNPNNPDIFAYERINDPTDPLSITRAGPRTYKQSSPIYTTRFAASAAAKTILSRVSTQRGKKVSVACTPEALLLELGDFGWVRDPVQRRAVLGEVSSITVPLDPTSPVQVEIIVSQEV